MSTNPQEPRPRHPRRRRDPRTRSQTVVRPASAEGAAQAAAVKPPPSTAQARRSEETGASVLYLYVLSDLKLTGIFMATVIGLLIVLWIVLD
ncbi:MAG: hypothetical protein FJZ95_02255 [Chloroflexi bacterium]|nr:hypothetical protein [Chloroflexota bacterium]